MSVSLLILVLVGIPLLPTAAQVRIELTGQVLDPAGATIAGAEVTLVDEANHTFRAKTSAQGSFRLTSLHAGAYQLVVTAKGFEPYQDLEFKLSNSQRDPLTIKLQVVIRANVEVDERRGARTSTEPDRNLSALVLGPEEIASLPDDPDELLRVLQEMAGPGVDVSVYVNGFRETGRLPPKDSILRVSINASPYSAEFSEPGFGRIEITTKPGGGVLHASMSLGFNDESLNARNAFANRRAPHQSRRFSGNLNGPIIRNKLAFFLDLQRIENDDNQVISATVLDPVTLQFGPFNGNALTPTRSTYADLRNDFQFNKSNSGMLAYRYFSTKAGNLGVGGFSLPEHGFKSSSYQHLLRLSDTHVLSKTMINDFRLQLSRQNITQRSLSSAQEIDVQQFFFGGGAQRALFRNQTTDRMDLNDNLSYVHRKHNLKGGVQVNRVNVRTENRANYGGTFTFRDGTQYLNVVTHQPNARAEQFSINSGDSFGNATVWQFSWFLLDDWRARPNLTISAGLRHEFQTHVPDKLNLAPRLSVAWGVGPAKFGKAPDTVIRAGFGMFLSRLDENSLLTVGLADGKHQLTTTIPCASFPNPLLTDSSTCPDPTIRVVSGPTVLPTIRTFQPDLKIPYIIQWSISVDRNLPAKIGLAVTYQENRGVHMFRSRDVNAPLPGSGLIPNPKQGPTLEVESNGNSIRRAIAFNARRQFGVNITLFAGYTLGWSYNDYAGGGGISIVSGSGAFSISGSGAGSGVFSLPADSYNLRQELGRASSDARHTFTIGGFFRLPHGISVSPFFLLRSSGVFNITTGHDNNGDTHINDRPAFADAQTTDNDRVVTQFGVFDINPKPGQTIVPRDYGIGPGFFLSNVSVSKSFGWGKGRAAGGSLTPTPIGTGGGGGGATVASFGGGGDRSKRYNITLSISASNIFNHTTLAAINGVLPRPVISGSASSGSSFSQFGRANASLPARRVEANLRFNW